MSAEIYKQNIIIFHVQSAILLSEETPSAELEELLEDNAANASTDEEHAVWESLLHYVRSLY